MGVPVADDESVWVIDSATGGEEEIDFFNVQTGEPITAEFGESAQVVQSVGF